MTTLADWMFRPVPPAWICAGSAEGVRTGRLEEKRIPHIAVPATAGSGAEATANGVLYEGGVKLSIGHPSLRPEGVILDLLPPWYIDEEEKRQR